MNEFDRVLDDPHSAELESELLFLSCSRSNETNSKQRNSIPAAETRYIFFSVMWICSSMFYPKKRRWNRCWIIDDMTLRSRLKFIRYSCSDERLRCFWGSQNKRKPILQKIKRPSDKGLIEEFDPVLRTDQFSKSFEVQEKFIKLTSFS